MRSQSNNYVIIFGVAQLSHKAAYACACSAFAGASLALNCPVAGLPPDLTGLRRMAPPYINHHSPLEILTAQQMVAGLRLNSTTAFAAFDKMEERVVAMEAEVGHQSRGSTGLLLLFAGC
jgi:hypothetical protein